MKERTMRGRLHKGRISLNKVGIHLLNIGAVALSRPADPTFATRIAPAPSATLDTNGLLRPKREEGGADGLVAMDADEVTT